MIGYLAASWATSPVRSVSVPLSTTSIERQTLLKCSNSEIDFGIVEQGGHRETAVWLENPGSEPVEILAIRTSCDCFEVTIERKVVEAGDRVKAVAKIDFRDDPRYRGKLGLEAEGTAKHKKANAFFIKANVTVR
jgi:hypothetical protein